MSEVKTCPDCGYTDHISSLWPYCPVCGIDDEVDEGVQIAGRDFEVVKRNKKPDEETRQDENETSADSYEMIIKRHKEELTNVRGQLAKAQAELNNAYNEGLEAAALVAVEISNSYAINKIRALKRNT